MSLEILKKYKIRAKKSLWQNFLVNDDIVEEIANTIDVEWKNIVEVWPWYGALTEKLISRKPKSLNLVEIDNDMISILNSRIDEWNFDLANIDFSIKNIDVLKYEPEFKSYSLIANIPYYITSPILRHFLYDIENKPESMVILMQKDVWDKILWKGKNKSSVLSLFVDKKSLVWEFLEVTKQNFVPVPKVESSVLIFELHDKYSDVDDDLFLEIIKKGFNAPRKMLIKNFVNSWFNKELILNIFKELWIEDNIRGEDLWIDKWIELVKKINKK
jgi:16S rRNA (adenine1518-N6/adenine1519-N6)-dimethyltransferase